MGEEFNECYEWLFEKSIKNLKDAITIKMKAIEHCEQIQEENRIKKMERIKQREMQMNSNESIDLNSSDMEHKESPEQGVDKVEYQIKSLHLDQLE